MSSSSSSTPSSRWDMFPGVRYCNEIHIIINCCVAIVYNRERFHFGCGTSSSTPSSGLRLLSLYRTYSSLVLLRCLALLGVSSVHLSALTKSHVLKPMNHHCRPTSGQWHPQYSFYLHSIFDSLDSKEPHGAVHILQILL
jgi:hypothetical protein